MYNGSRLIVHCSAVIFGWSITFHESLGQQKPIFNLPFLERHFWHQCCVMSMLLVSVFLIPLLLIADGPIILLAEYKCDCCWWTIILGLILISVYRAWKIALIQHIESWTELPPFCRWHFKCLSLWMQNVICWFIFDGTFFSWESIGNK